MENLLLNSEIFQNYEFIRVMTFLFELLTSSSRICIQIWILFFKGEISLNISKNITELKFFKKNLTKIWLIFLYSADLKITGKFTEENSGLFYIFSFKWIHFRKIIVYLWAFFDHFVKMWTFRFTCPCFVWSSEQSGTTFDILLIQVLILSRRLRSTSLCCCRLWWSFLITISISIFKF